MKQNIEANNFFKEQEQKMDKYPIPAVSAKLGARYSQKKDGRPVLNCSIWAPSASAVILQLYKNYDALEPSFSVPCSYDANTGIWTVSFDTTDPDGFFYTYLITNEKGTKECLDPYSVSMSAFLNDNTSGRGAVINWESPKLNLSRDYVDNRVPIKNKNEAIVYEISVRDFTISPDSSVTEKPGTYLAFIQKLQYLKELGITHIQLMPVLNFYNNNEVVQKPELEKRVQHNNYNWGYDPHSYFSPEGWYSSEPTDPYKRIKELRELIAAAHELGLRVILDVVYNHMAKTDFLEDIVPYYYFRHNEDCSFTSNSGCGNDLATEREMAGRIVQDSTSFWTKEYKVDGFRFDLMGIIESEVMLKSYAGCVLSCPDTFFIGEGWRMYNGKPGTRGIDQDFMGFTSLISVFSDEYRDLLKAGGMNEQGLGFLTGKPTSPERLFYNLTARPGNFISLDPCNVVQYLVCHDGLTLHDTISANYELDPLVESENAELFKRIRIGNFILLTSQGIAFLHGGQERGRTKPGFGAVNECVKAYVRNSYDSSDAVNLIKWTMSDLESNLLKYTTSLINLRKSLGVFNLENYKEISDKVFLLKDSDEFSIGYFIKSENAIYFILVNMNEIEKNFTLSHTEIGKTNSIPLVLVDSENVNLLGLEKPCGVTIKDGEIALKPLSCALIKLEC